MFEKMSMKARKQKESSDFFFFSKNFNFRGSKNNTLHLQLFEIHKQSMIETI